MFIPIFLTIVLAFSTIPNVYAISFNTRSSADTTIRSDQPDTNLGTSAVMYVRSGSTVNVGRALVQFDLSSIPPGAIINSAYLTLYYDIWAINNPSGRTYTAYRVTTNWIEGDSIFGATWNEADHNVAGHATCVDWTNGGEWTMEDAASQTVPATPAQFMTWTVTGIVEDWVTNGQSNYGFIIKDPNDGVAGTDATAYFNTREWVIEGQRPILEIEYTSANAVGGFFAPTNKLVILTPYIALVGLIGAISTIFAIRRWQRD